MNMPSNMPINGAVSANLSARVFKSRTTLEVNVRATDLPLSGVLNRDDVCRWTRKAGISRRNNAQNNNESKISSNALIVSQHSALFVPNSSSANAPRSVGHIQRDITSKNHHTESVTHTHTCSHRMLTGVDITPKGKRVANASDPRAAAIAAQVCGSKETKS